MIIRDVIQVGNPIIRARSRIVKDIKRKEIQELVINLIDTMRDAKLVGMAAPQIGINFRVFVSEIRRTDTRNENGCDPVRVFINPKILSFSKNKIEMFEGCGSVAASGLFAPVNRAEKVIVEAYNVRGEKFVLKAEGLLARIIQHEVDHLDGRVFLDRQYKKMKMMSRSEYIKMIEK